MTDLTAKQILAVPLDQPERLFGTIDAITTLYKQLAKHWHPDVPTGNTEVFTRISTLHDAAIAKRDSGTWHVPGSLQLTGTDGKTRRIRYIKEFDCGLGKAYMGQSIISYVITDDYADLFHDAEGAIRGLKFPNDTERNQLSSCLPTIKATFATATSLVMVVEKPIGTIRLRDLLDHVGKIDPKHTAWIINRLLNLVCFLHYNKWSHGDISLDSLFVSPERHSVAILGGWWYSTPLGSRMARIQPVRTLAVAPKSVLTTKLADIKTDLELVRLIGREILGDASGIKLAAANVPVDMIEWLRSTTAGNPIADYDRWPEVLKRSFGERRFVKWPVTFNDIYKG